MKLKIQDLKSGFIVSDNYAEAIRGIDLSVAENEVVGLVGESGCGKTATALSIMRLLPENGRIKSGEILFEGKNLLSLSEKEMLDIRGQRIAMIFQEPFTALNPVIRIGSQISEAVLAHPVRNIISNGAGKHISKEGARALALDLLKQVRLDDPQRIYYSYPHQLSGGQRQRVLIAIALVHNPGLLIADEPTTALDVTTQSEILQLLLELKKEMKMSVLFITHDLGIINEVADKICVMKDGSIVERGNKNEILSAPKHQYTKRLIAALPDIDGASTEAAGVDSADILIETKSLSKSFAIQRGLLRKATGEIKAVKDVNLRIKKGEAFGLVGESGCGKTTLGRLLIGLITPDQGEIFVSGKPLRKYLKDTPRRIRQMMQIVFQDPYSSLDPRMRMGDIVLEGPAILGKKGFEKEAILKAVLAQVHLSLQDRRKYPHQFSGGQRQRIAIARALATRPEFLILDEPVSSLDVLIQKDILDLLRALQKELSLTYLFISHDLRVVELMSDEIAVMYQGSIVEVASSKSIYTNPGHPYTKHLLESIPKWRIR
jgi:peptide/nickel transport system ATP-binding protein